MMFCERTEYVQRKSVRASGLGSGISECSGDHLLQKMAIDYFTPGTQDVVLKCSVHVHIWTLAALCRVREAARVQVDYQIGRNYYPVQGFELRLPSTAVDRLDAGFLEWQNRNVFRQ